ncbi:MAG: hypothetical protein SPE03_11930 [Treponema sp.]|nr:hypothetical protein [Treponema sp.]
MQAFSTCRDRPYLFETWFKQFPDVEVHLAHCKDSAPIIDLFIKYKRFNFEYLIYKPWQGL